METYPPGPVINRFLEKLHKYTILSEIIQRLNIHHKRNDRRINPPGPVPAIVGSSRPATDSRWPPCCV